MYCTYISDHHEVKNRPLVESRVCCVGHGWSRHTRIEREGGVGGGDEEVREKAIRHTRNNITEKRERERGAHRSHSAVNLMNEVGIEGGRNKRGKEGWVGGLYASRWHRFPLGIG